MKKVLSFLFATVLLTGYGFAQTSSEQEIFKVVEEMPEFEGGQKGLINFLVENIKYPGTAKTEGVEEKVFITFIIETDGSVSGAKVMQGEDFRLTREALRVVNSMPKSTPGKQRRKAVRVQYTLPINFTLS